MFDDGDNDDDLIPSARWLHLLSPMERAWRETQFLKGRDPDSYIEGQLREAGKWPPEDEQLDGNPGQKRPADAVVGAVKVAKDSP